MSKKWLKFVLSTTLLFSSMIGVSANEITPYGGMSENHQVHTFNSFSPTTPSREYMSNISATLSVRSYRAERQPNGDVILTINEKMNTTYCYYRFFATNASGTEFVPSKDLEFYIDGVGTHTVLLPADSVSEQGYVYIHFAMNPGKGSVLLDESDYAVPVDYDDYKIVEDDYLTLDVGQTYKLTGMNGQFLDLNATATRRSNGNVLLNLDVLNTNTSVQFEHMVSDREIFFPSRFNKYAVLDTGKMNISLYKDNVVRSNYIYLRIYFDTANGNGYAVEQVRIPIQ